MAIKNKIFFDLDGPILDVSEKYYRLYYDILNKNNLKALSKKTFWSLKRDEVGIENILDRSRAKHFVHHYQKQWKKLIESDYYLGFDRLQPTVKKILNQLSREYDIILVTLRSSRKQLIKELENLEIEKYFSEILSSGSVLKPRWKIKYGLIKKYGKVKGISIKGTFIGDTATDIVAAKKLGLYSVATENGIRNKAALKIINPDLIISNLRKLNLKKIK